MAITGDFRGTSLSSFAIGKRRTTYDSVEPSLKAIGDLWYELDGSGDIRYDWAWKWDGLYWRSMPLFEERLNSSLEASIEHYFRIDKRFNYLIKAFQPYYLTLTPQTTSNYWRFRLERRTTSNVATLMASAISAPTDPLNQFIDLKQTLNLVVNQTLFDLLVLLLAKTGTPGAIYGEIKFFYHYLRI
jgi:hypothetical protein